MALAVLAVVAFVTGEEGQREIERQRERQEREQR